MPEFGFSSSVVKIGQDLSHSKEVEEDVARKSHALIEVEMKEGRCEVDSTAAASVQRVTR